MEPLTNPHDRFFKQLLAEPGVVNDFIRHYLPPEVARLLDLTSLELTKDTFVDEKLKEYF